MADPHLPSFELAYLTAREVVARLENGSLTSTQLVTALIERIQNIDVDGTTTSLHSIAAVHEDSNFPCPFVAEDPRICCDGSLSSFRSGT